MNEYPTTGPQQPWQGQPGQGPQSQPSQPQYPPPLEPYPVHIPQQGYPQQPPPGYPQQSGYPPQGYQQFPPMPPLQPPVQVIVQQKKSRLVPIIGILVGAVVLCTIIGAISGTNNSNTSTKVDTSSSSLLPDSGKSGPAQLLSTQIPTLQPTQSSTHHFKVGETLNIGGIWEAVISNVRTSPGGQYDSIASGNVYLLIDAAFKNVSNKEQSLYANIGWTLRDASGTKFDNGYNSDSTPPNGKVEPGDPAKGTLEYVVPATTKQFTLGFEESMFESGQTIWDISVP